MSEITIKQLYEEQTELYEQIIKEKGLEGQDLLPSTVLALQVELAELANEWRVFKYWSNDREPRTQVRCVRCEGEGWRYEYVCKYLGPVEKIKTHCGHCGGKGYIKQPLLEEYADCLSFFLSIARQIGLSADKVEPIYQEEIDPKLSTVKLISITISKVTEIPETHYWSKENFLESYSLFRELGARFGLTWDQIAEAYMKKNKINYERLANGY